MDMEAPVEANGHNSRVHYGPYDHDRALAKGLEMLQYPHLDVRVYHD